MVCPPGVGLEIRFLEVQNVWFRRAKFLADRTPLADRRRRVRRRGADADRFRVFKVMQRSGNIDPRRCADMSKEPGGPFSNQAFLPPLRLEGRPPFGSALRAVLPPTASTTRRVTSRIGSAAAHRPHRPS